MRIMLLLSYIIGLLAMFCKVCEGLSCRECLDIELTSSASGLEDTLASGSTSDPSCKHEGEHARSAECKWSDGILDGSDLADLDDSDGEVLDYYNSRDWDTVVCQKEYSTLTVYVSGETITATIWSRGCKAVQSDVSMSCYDDVAKYEHALMSTLARQVRMQLAGTLSRTTVSGSICFCNTDNCNFGAPTTPTTTSTSTVSAAKTTSTVSPGVNSASFRTAAVWIVALSLLTTAATFLSRG